MQPTEDISERLAMISAELAHIANLLANPQLQPVFPDAARMQFASGVCLHPGCKVKRADKQFRRGNCPTHYAKLMKVIAMRGAIADFGFVEKGLLAPEGYNPNPTEFDDAVQALDEQESRLIAAAQATTAKPARRKRKSN